MQRIRPLLASSGKPEKRGLLGRSRRAFTILEVAIAGTVLLMGLCSCLLALQKGYIAIDTARRSSMAAQLMQSEIERLRMKSWTEIYALKNTGEDITGTVSAMYANSDAAANFTVTRSITEPKASMLVIKVTVTWTGMNNISHTRSLQTQYSKNGLHDFYYTIKS
jgi:Tfp pilus assembly protein PilV